MKQPHKHAEVIKAWADGAEIQWFEDYAWHDWVWSHAPAFMHHDEYRIKHEPKPDVVTFAFAEKDHLAYEATQYQLDADNLRLTFDGETGKLKKAEVLK